MGDVDTTHVFCCFFLAHDGRESCVVSDVFFFLITIDVIRALYCVFFFVHRGQGSCIDFVEFSL